MDGHYGPKSGGGGATPASSAVTAGGKIDLAKIFVGGLSWQTTEETLRYHFEQYGEVSTVEVMRDRNTGDPRGFAFVVFKEDSTVELIQSSGPHEINHKVVDVKRAQARGQAPPSIHKNQESSEVGDGEESTQPQRKPNEPTPEQLQNKVFVGGLPLHIDKDGMSQFFSQYGAVTDTIVMMDHVNNRSRGFGFVTFENGSGGAQLALAAQPVYIDGKYVEIKLATPKGEQQRGGIRGQGGGMGRGTVGPTVAQSSGEFAGLAASYGRSGWRAGYGTKAFGASGWGVLGWDSGGPAPERSGFSFQMLKITSKGRNGRHRSGGERETKRARH
uniref:RRM domain-containing protein n=1 Tax=Odontella aurita TaxID=265563 RepID=A0A7S4NCW7_9STRA|mmetsp:Transcript_59256/g.176072  ORF Transcript_59256/g.176072 Transcript_59256/m.176072 type:complete len:330 (+) Transcript_59256:118-1107(+)|eukprot:CAMPEP_0113525810 /NCGR_PEP_ID=MMETSP0015_2-20120614/383_1 /TAXON_ID=2838 /ORGANISM="Odontella" /LENGTH=329 /DNA_ID=CAMNT_0000424047 /DNA_START=71 /DNA_END=1060 /DNA_ORIENTATION=- /assembly_acc=CAM_ASM_000160